MKKKKALIHPSFPVQAAPMAASMGSQSSTPDKMDSSGEPAMPGEPGMY